MNKLKAEQVSPFFNARVGRTDGGKPSRAHPIDVERGKRMRKIELIQDIQALGEELMEVWEDD